MAQEYRTNVDLDAALHLIFGRENMNATVTANANEGASGAVVELTDRGELFEVAPDTRNGTEGFRVSRYRMSDDTEDGDNWEWDTWYQFYPSLNAFADAVTNRDYEQGIKAFG